ncbi:MAG: hypothetical protein K1X74_19280 [Pirellulales bacterium]|nr:hypothetical protein [Pirellulales bacterium]
MLVRDARSPAALGFLTVVDLPESGLVGGYLVLNAAGRPLEFHCTAPVRPNRAQEILYGPTLRPYLYGEQIGRTLMTKSTADVRLICTDEEPVLALRDHAKVPVVLVEQAGEQVPASSEASATKKFRVDAPHAGLPRLHYVALGSARVAVAPQHAADATLCAGLGELVSALDLSEPFGRIREALVETQRGNR